MAARISLACENYFSGIRDLSTFNNNNSSTKALTVLKVISYFTLILPLFFAMLYYISSLVGRVTVPTSASPQDGKVAAAVKRVRGQSVKEQLDTLFASTVKTQKLFTIDESKVGVVFNPNGGSFRVGFMTCEDPILLVSDRAIPDEVVKRITAKIPPHLSHSSLIVGRINGVTPFRELGLE
jgi:hypothetical protein